LSTSAIDLDIHGQPVIAFEIYYPAPINSGYLLCAHINGPSWNIDTVIRGGYHIVYSLKVDNSNRVHIFYQSDIQVFYTVESGDTWNTDFLGLNAEGECGGELVLDGNIPKVVYSSIFDPLYYAYKIDSLWRYERIQPEGPGLYPSLAKDNTIDFESSMHVCYLVGWNILSYAHRNLPAIAEKTGVWINLSKIPVGIYPNPAKSFLAIRLPQAVDFQTLKIFDVSGKVIKEITAPSNRNNREIKISLKGISTGIYILRFGKETKKFLVVK